MHTFAGPSIRCRIVASRPCLAGHAVDALFRLPAAAGEIPAIASRQRAEKKSFTDSEIIEGFLKTAFGAEYHLAGRVDRIRKYDMPVRVFADGAARADRKAQLAKVVADIGQRIQHLDIAMVPERRRRQCHRQSGARPRPIAHHRADSTAANAQARFAPRSIRNACPAFARTSSSRSSIPTCILTVDSGDFIFLDCAYEELLQSLGPINDTSSVPWTMFNDEVPMGFFDVYDQYILNLLYDPAHQGRHDRAAGGLR